MPILTVCLSMSMARIPAVAVTAAPCRRIAPSSHQRYSPGPRGPPCSTRGTGAAVCGRCRAGARRHKPRPTCRFPLSSPAGHARGCCGAAGQTSPAADGEVVLAWLPAAAIGRGTAVEAALCLFDRLRCQIGGERRQAGVAEVAGGSDQTVQVAGVDRYHATYHSTVTPPRPGMATR